MTCPRLCSWSSWSRLYSRNLTPPSAIITSMMKKLSDWKRSSTFPIVSKQRSIKLQRKKNKRKWGEMRSRFNSWKLQLQALPRKSKAIQKCKMLAKGMMTRPHWTQRKKITTWCWKNSSNLRTDSQEGYKTSDRRIMNISSNLWRRSSASIRNLIYPSSTSWIIILRKMLP